MNAIRALATAALALACAAPFALSQDASQIKPLIVGSDVPDVTLQSASGETVKLRSLTQDELSIIVFYRGGWCPYCNTQLAGLAEIESQLADMGYQIIAISPDSPENLKSAEKKGELNYELYSDSDFEAIDAFEIGFTLAPETLKQYKDYGIDLAEVSGGENENRLPVPAVFIAGPDNVIRFVYANPDYTTRISTDKLLSAAKAAKRRRADA